MGSSRRVVLRVSTEGRYSSPDSLPLRMATYFFVLTKPCLATGLILTIVGYTTHLDSVAAFEILGPFLIALSAFFFLFCGTCISPQYRKWFSDTFIHKGKVIQQNSTIRATYRSRDTTEDPRVIIIAKGSESPVFYHKGSKVEPLSLERDFGDTGTVPYPKPEELYKFNKSPLAVPETCKVELTNVNKIEMKEEKQGI